MSPPIDPDENDEIPQPRHSPPLPTPVTSMSHTDDELLSPKREGSPAAAAAAAVVLPAALSIKLKNLVDSPQNNSFLKSYTDLSNKSEIRNSLSTLLDVFENVIDEAFSLGEAVSYWQQKEEESRQRLEMVLEEMRRGKGGANTTTTRGGETVEHLKSLLRQLQKRNDELTNQVQMQSKDFLSEKKKLEDDVSRLTNDKIDLKRSLEKMDRERDNLESQIDELTNNLSLRTTMLSCKNEQHPSAAAAADDDTTTTVDEMTKTIFELKNTLSLRTDELSHLQQTFTNLQTTNDDLTSTLATKTNDLHRAEGDISAMIRENQALSNEQTRLRTEFDATRMRLDESNATIDRLQQSHRALQLEKDDVLHNYRIVVDDRSGLESRLHDLSTVRLPRLRCELERTKEDNVRLRSQLDDGAELLQKRSSDVAALERDLERLSRGMIVQQRTVDAADDENRRLTTDLGRCRESYARVSRHAEELQRDAARWGQEVNGLRGALEAMEGEREALQQLLGRERDKVEGLEMLLDAGRAKESAAEEQIRKLARETAELGTRLNEAQAKLVGGGGGGGGGNEKWKMMGVVTATTTATAEMKSPMSGSGSSSCGRGVNVTCSPSPVAATPSLCDYLNGDI